MKNQNLWGSFQDEVNAALKEKKNPRRISSASSYNYSPPSFADKVIAFAVIILIIYGIICGLGYVFTKLCSKSTEEVKEEVKVPFKLPNPEVLVWVNGKEASDFIGGNACNLIGTTEKSEYNWFLTRIDLTTFNVTTNGTKIIITRHT